MTIEGAGWEVIDLGVDVKTDRILQEIDKNPKSIVGLSACSQQPCKTCSRQWKL